MKWLKALFSKGNGGRIDAQKRPEIDWAKQWVELSPGFEVRGLDLNSACAELEIAVADAIVELKKVKGLPNAKNFANMLSGELNGLCGALRLVGGERYVGRSFDLGWAQNVLELVGPAKVAEVRDGMSVFPERFINRIVKNEEARTIDGTSPLEPVGLIPAPPEG